MTFDPFDLARARAMLRGYHAMWCREEMTVLAVEAPFTVPLVNPETGRASRSFLLHGKLDAVVRIGEDVFVVEHKTSSEDIGPGSIYWRKLRMDSQVSLYAAAAKELGLGEVGGVIYDVLGKPKHKPLQANKQREVPESPSEYEARCLAAIAEAPADYYARGTIVRTAEEADDAAFDLWSVSQQILEAERVKRFHRNVEACFHFQRACEYWPVCTGEVAIEDETRYYTRPVPEERKLRVLSVSEARSWRACARKHHFAYRLRRRSRADAPALRFGTMVHRGLETWWKTVDLNAALAAMEVEDERE